MLFLIFTSDLAKCCQRAVFVQDQRQSELDVLGKLDERNGLDRSSEP